MYMIIAYIYMIASVMIMKENFNKGAGEVVTVEGQVIKTENLDDDENKEENEEDKKKEPKDKDKDKTDEEKQNETIPENDKDDISKNQVDVNSNDITEKAEEENNKDN